MASVASILTTTSTFYAPTPRAVPIVTERTTRGDSGVHLLFFVSSLPLSVVYVDGFVFSWGVKKLTLFIIPPLVFLSCSRLFGGEARGERVARLARYLFLSFLSCGILGLLLRVCSVRGAAADRGEVPYTVSCDSAVILAVVRAGTGADVDNGADVFPS